MSLEQGIENVMIAVFGAIAIHVGINLFFLFKDKDKYFEGHPDYDR